MEENGSLIHLAPAMLEFLGVRYTGCPSQAMYLTTNKKLKGARPHMLYQYTYYKGLDWSY